MCRAGGVRVAQKVLDNIKGLEGDERLACKFGAGHRRADPPDAGQEGALIVQEVKARKGNEG